MEVAPMRAAAVSLYQEQTYYFCARTCKEHFDKDPDRYLQPDHQLPEYARTLYEALGTLSKVFYGSTMRAGIGRDLTQAEWDVLRFLGGEGECKMRELATGCGAALSTMTGIIDRLVKKGMVQRRHGQADRRVVLIKLTGRGKLAYEERVDTDMRLILTMLQALKAEEQHALVTLLRKVVRSLP
jgi:DNA-binding MarR family transcriptional regulator/YHS domain-containing protein